jgi:hypothetical protein
MAATNPIPLRPMALTERHLRQLAERIASRGVALAPDSPTLAGDLHAGSRAICGLLDKLKAAVGPAAAARVIAEISLSGEG